MYQDQAPLSDAPDHTHNHSNAKRNSKKLFGIVLLIIISLAIGVLIGRSSIADGPSLISRTAAGDLDLSLFNKVKNIIQTKYVHAPVDNEQLEYGAIKGLVKGTGDAHSNFMDPEETKAFQETLAGVFQGIGIEIALRKEALTVVAPLEGTPAAAAGLKAGDIILAIDKINASALSLDEAVTKIRGKKGTKVVLTIKRKDKFDARDFAITRDEINIDSAEFSVRDDGIGVLNIFRFGEDTSHIVRRAANKFLEQNVKGIVLDLRNDPGGFLETGVDVASYFIKDGVIVSEEFGDGSRQEYKAKGKARLENIPLVVLIDSGSASASEIVAGALQDYQKADLVGEKSFGKGSVQELQSLDRNTSLRLTVALFVLPNGRKIDKKGIEPDHEVKITEADIEAGRDPQMDKAIEVLHNKI